MAIRCNTAAEAAEVAATLRRIHAGEDWVVTINRPLFPGDFYLVVVG